MMKRFSFFLVLLFLAGLARLRAESSSIRKQTDSLLAVLDNKIQDYPVVDVRRENDIRQLNGKLAGVHSPESRFKIYGELFERYKTYQIDSAVNIALRRRHEASMTKNEKYIALSKLNYAEVMINSSIYKSALDTIQQQERRFVDADLKAYIFHLYHSSYLLISEFALTDEERADNRRLVMQYKDSILTILPKDNIGYYLVMSSKLIELRQPRKALQWALEAYRKFADTPHSTALTAYAAAIAYGQLGDAQMEKKYLVVSAIGDIMTGVKEYISLRKLAVILYREGDIERAYRYTKRSMEDAIFCNARFRTYEISQMLPIINSAYDQKIKKEKQNLKAGILLISVLSLFLVGGFIFTYKQLLALARARRALKVINSDLQAINTDLTRANEKLSESDQVKEEYIGYVFAMCSNYIDKMEDLRKKVSRKLNVGQIEELHKLTSSTNFVSDELKEFYRSFDSVFLNLYPDFVKEFNSLLLPGEEVMPKANDLLTPELRIFALVRLGVNDSSKIAQFLHYSPQTVYNYRLKIRTKARASKNDFSKEVAQIGRIRR